MYVLEYIFDSNLYWNRDTQSFKTIENATQYTEESLKHCIEHHKDRLPNLYMFKVVIIQKL